MTNLLLAAIIGITFALCLFVALAIIFVPGFFERLWRKVTKPLGIALVLGWAIVSMAAVTQIDLTTQVKNILPSANGGTGNAYFGISGPTALRTYALPDASATILTSNTPVSVAQGGTGAATLSSHGVMLGEATSSPNLAGATANSQCFMSPSSNYATTDPLFQSCPSAPNQNQGAPSGSINGSNTTFTLSPTPAASSNVNCFENGLQQRQGAGLDYTISGATITYLTAPPTGTTLNCLWY